MKLIQWISVLGMIALFSVSCEDKKNKDDDSKSEKRASQRNKRSSPDEQKEVDAKGVAAKRESPQQSMPQHLQDAFNRIKKGAPKLVAFKEAWDVSWDKSMSEKLVCGDKVASGLILSEDIKTFHQNTPDSIFTLLTSGRSIDGFDRSKVIIYSSVLAGLSLERDTAKNIPLILNKHANTLPPVKGDILLSKVAEDTSELLDPVGDFTEGDVAQWKKLAGAKNPVYRMIALRFFGRLCSEQEKEKQFFESYLKETDPEIGMVFIDEVMRSPLEGRKKLLLVFESEQKKLGNSEVAESARDMIEQN